MDELQLPWLFLPIIEMLAVIHGARRCCCDHP